MTDEDLFSLPDKEPADLFDLPQPPRDLTDALEGGKERSKEAISMPEDPIHIIRDSMTLNTQRWAAYDAAYQQWEKDMVKFRVKEAEARAKRTKGRPKEDDWLLHNKEPEKPVPPTGKRPKSVKAPPSPAPTDYGVSPQQKAKQDAVALMVSCGLNQTTISSLLGMSKDKLQKLFRPELDFGKDILTSRVANALVQKALDGNVMAAIFWLKSRAGWRETTELELSKKEGENISEVEREQRLMSIMLQNPSIRAKIEQKKRLKEAGVNTTITMPSESKDDNRGEEAAVRRTEDSDSTPSGESDA